jgi:FkbM family methyltransferase
MLSLFCDRSRVSLDIGANRGQYAYFLSKVSHEVICFEPNPNLARYLRSGRLPRVIINESALSDSAGVGFLYIPQRGAGEDDDGVSSLDALHLGDRPLRRIEVAIQRLDDLNLHDVGFMKIDVEGLEAAVLRGGASLIARDRPVLLVESEHRHAPTAPNSVFELLASQGYCGFFWIADRWHSVARFRLEVHQKIHHAPDGGGEKRGLYVNNFLFIPIEPKFAELSEKINAIE